MSGWLSGWFVNNAGTLEFNETKLNDTIDARAGGDNESWNESYADTLYAGIEWDYNQSTPVFNYISANEENWVSTYNATYDAYNNTGEAIRKKDLIHKNAEANRAFAHFRW